MSIKVMTEVWDYAPCMGTDLLVFLAIADSANDERGCWPSLRSIAKKARIQLRQCIRIVQDLELQGFIEIEHRKDERRNNLSNRYYIRKVEDWLLLWAYEVTNPSVPCDTTPSVSQDTTLVSPVTVGVLRSEGENVTEPSYEPKIETNTSKPKRSKQSAAVIFRQEWEANAQLGNALLQAFGLDFVPASNQTKAALEPYLEVAKELSAVGATIEQIPLLKTYIDKRAKTEEWSKYSVKTFARYYTEFLKLQASKKIIQDDLVQPQEEILSVFQQIERDRKARENG